MFCNCFTGGRMGKSPVTAVEVYSFKDQKWRELAKIPSKRVFPGYCVSDTHIFSIGGLKENPKEGFSNDTEIFDIEKGK